ncbi:hypothetical protein BH23ACT6_BH23ACT6_17030 [soil metagenome]
MADVILPPFEMAVRLGKAGSVMNSYADLDGMPPAADHALLTDLLRDEWGFEGTVVSDYWAIAFLHQTQRVSASSQESAVLALTAGIDIELPETGTYTHLPHAVEAGDVAEDLVDEAARRVLRQKAELGLLDPGWSPAGDPSRDLDSEGNRDLARRTAEASIVLLGNDGTLPLKRPGRVAVIGPVADDPRVMMGCYAFANHVMTGSDDLGVPIDTVLEALRTEMASAAGAMSGAVSAAATSDDGPTTASARPIAWRTPRGATSRAKTPADSLRRSPRPMRQTWCY